MEKMEFIYTSGWEKFEQYCKELYRGYLNRYCQGNEKACEDEINKAYAMGMNFIREKVKENKEILKQLWIAAFIGNLARKYDLTVTVRTQSCVFILGLFNLLPYDAMKTTSINYPFSNLSLTEYEVGELFYNTAKREIEAFFHDSGQEILWLGSVEKDEIQPIGIAVLPEGKTKLDYIKNCVKLTDGSIGLIEETTSAYNETEEFIAEIYYFLPTKRTTKLDMDICEGLKIDKTENFVCSWGNMIETGFMTPEEEVRFQYLKPDTEFEMMEILALCMADVNYPELVDENILFSVYPFTREGKNGEEEIIFTDWYLEKDFTDSELRLLIDSLLFSKHIPYSQCKALIEKLEGLSNCYFKSRIKHIQTMPDTEPQNKQLFYTIEMLDKAITKGRQVAFYYNEYHTDMKMYPRENEKGEKRRYIINPYQIAAINGRYYLICNYDKYDNVANYRLDRITDIEILPVPVKPMKKVKGLENGLNLPKHMAEHIYMFTGESAAVTFRAKKYLVSEIIDWFGKDIKFSDETEDEVTVRVMVNLEAMRKWALQYAVHVKILSPGKLVDMVKEDIKKASEQYKGEH